MILCADDYPADFSYLRSQAVEITLDTRTGFYLPDSALHTVNGDVGVYVLDGSVAVFRRVEILYRGDGFALASADAEGSTELSLNDLIITSGENLYDGKVYS